MFNYSLSKQSFPTPQSMSRIQQQQQQQQQQQTSQYHQQQLQQQPSLQYQQQKAVPFQSQQFFSRQLSDEIQIKSSTPTSVQNKSYSTHSFVVQPRTNMPECDFNIFNPPSSTSLFSSVPAPSSSTSMISKPTLMQNNITYSTSQLTRANILPNSQNINSITNDNNNYNSSSSINSVNNNNNNKRVNTNTRVYSNTPEQINPYRHDVQIRQQEQQERQLQLFELERRERRAAQQILPTSVSVSSQSSLINPQRPTEYESRDQLHQRVYEQQPRQVQMLQQQRFQQQEQEQPQQVKTMKFYDQQSQERPANWTQVSSGLPSQIPVLIPSAPQQDDDRYRKQLIVNYLAPAVTSSELQTLFSQFGPLDGARVIYDRQTCMPRGYGFVYFHYP